MSSLIWDLPLFKAIFRTKTELTFFLNEAILLPYTVFAKTLYNKTVNSPQNVKSLSVLSPGIAGTTAFAIYQVWFYHITTSNYDIDPIKNNTYFTSQK